MFMRIAAFDCGPPRPPVIIWLAVSSVSVERIVTERERVCECFDDVGFGGLGLFEVRTLMGLARSLACAQI
jgi:hypothetical protein